MKKVIPIILVAVLVMGAQLSGCTTTGPGKVVTEEKEFTDFTRVEVDGIFEVEIVRSGSTGITVIAEKSLLDYVAVAKDGETLKIYLNPQHVFTDFTQQARNLKVKITMPAINGLQLSGETKGTITGFRSTGNFSLNVSGASSLDIKDMEVSDADFEVSGASELIGTVNASDVRFEVSGASTVKLEGSAKNIILNTSGASEVNLAGFIINNADVKLSGASEVSLDVRDKLDAKLSAASRLYFRGNPTMGIVSVSGASTIKHE